MRVEYIQRTFDTYWVVRFGSTFCLSTKMSYTVVIKTKMSPNSTVFVAIFCGMHSLLDFRETTTCVLANEYLDNKATTGKSGFVQDFTSI
jgi:hypothetical protein